MQRPADLLYVMVVHAMQGGGDSLAIGKVHDGNLQTRHIVVQHDEQWQASQIWLTPVMVPNALSAGVVCRP